VGHALQHAHGYAPLAIRNAIVPLASTGSNLSIVIFMIGMFMSFGTRPLADGSIPWGMGQYMMVAGLALFSTVVIFQLINLPVEFDASRRAKYILVNQNIIAEGERAPVAKVLNAAALTYVAATLSAILTLLYLLMRSGLLGGRRD
jgi:Zn-dependent membrane protease YugP